jgi:hypothetical protein
MALIFIEGFEDYGANAGIQTHWEVPLRTLPSLVSGRFGGSALERPIWNDDSVEYTTGTITELFLGMAIKLDTLPSVSTVVGGFKHSTEARTPASVSVLADGSIQLDIDGNVETSASGVITAATWHYVELHILVGSTLACRVDEAVVATFSGTTGATLLNQVYLFDASTAHDTTLTIDDLYIDDNAYIGSIRIDSLSGTMADAGLGSATVLAVRPIVPTLSEFVSVSFGLGATFHTPPADVHTVLPSRLEWTSLSDTASWDMYGISVPPPEPPVNTYKRLMPARSILIVEENPDLSLPWTPTTVDLFSTTRQILDKT